MDIIKLPIEYAPDAVDSRFRLVLMAAQRVRQLADGAPPQVKTRYTKNTTIALEEAIDGKLRYLSGDEARRARDYEYKTRREKAAQRSREEAEAAALEKIEEIKEAYKAETTAPIEIIAGEVGLEDMVEDEEPTESLGEDDGSSRL